MTTKKRSNIWLLLLTMAIVGGILYFGLRSRTLPLDNNVRWLPDQKALRFLSPSIAYLKNFRFLEENVVDRFTLVMNIAATSVEIEGFRPILMLHNGDDQRQFSIWQWASSLIVMDGDDYDYKRKEPRLSARDILKKDRVIELVLSSGPAGTRLYLDGRLVKEQPDLYLTLPSGGGKVRLVLGNSVYSKHNWVGEISLLAIYDSIISPAEVLRRHGRWSSIVPSQQAADKLLLLYAFDSFENSVIRDQSGNGYDLQVPRGQKLLKKSILALPLKDFAFNRNFISDVLLNFFGFIPLGAVLFWWVLRAGGRSRFLPGGLVLLGCFLLSLAIEVAQAWLPDRTSSLLDVVLNAAGSLAGILLATLLFRLHRNIAASP